MMPIITFTDLLWVLVSGALIGFVVGFWYGYRFFGKKEG